MTEEVKKVMDKAADDVAMLSLEDRDPWEALKRQIRDHSVPADTERWLEEICANKKKACLLMLDLLQAKRCAPLPKVFASEYDVSLRWGTGLPFVTFSLYYDKYRVDYQKSWYRVDGGGFFPVSKGEEAVVECILQYVSIIKE